MALTELQTKLGGINVNGRVHYFDRLSNLRRNPQAMNEWLVDHRCGNTFEIFGGRRSGASARQWWVNSPVWNSPIHCTSLVDALKLLEGM